MNITGVAVAVRARLAGFTSLSGAVTYIGYDKPQDAQPEDLIQFPFTVIEDVSALPFGAKGTDGGNELIQVTTYARGTATKSAVTLAKETAQAAYDALHDFDLVVSGSNVINCLFDSSPGVMKDPDGESRYQPMIFRVVYMAS